MTWWTPFRSSLPLGPRESHQGILSGAEARGEGATTNRPYKQLFSYDALGHLTERSKYRWFLGAETSSDSYTNNRHDPVGQLWQYDADGNTVTMPGTAYVYDASGRIVTMTSGIPSTATLSWDGDGRKVKSVEAVWDFETETDITTTSYSIYSTVLGRVLTEFVYSDDPDITVPGFFTRTLVYGDSGGVIAYQMGYGGGSGEVWFEYRDPSNAAYRAITNVGAPSVEQELDPTGANQGVADPATQSIPDEGLLAPYPNTFNPSQPFAAFSLDGVRVSLDEFVQQVHFQFHGELGLNEAIAHGSANVPRTDWSPPTNSEDDSLLTSSSMWFFQTQTGGKVAHDAIDVDDLRSGIEDILKESKGRCAAFISSLIAGTATENNPVESTDILKLFNEVSKQGKFVYGDTIKQYYGLPGATNRGSIGGRDAQVELPTPWVGNNPTNNKDIAASQRRITLFSVMHELIHLSGKNRYGDIHLADTVAAMKGIAPPTYTGMTSKQAILTASINWTSSMEIACKPRRK